MRTQMKMEIDAKPNGGNWRNLLTLFSGYSGRAERFYALTELRGWWDYTIEYETAPSLFGTTNYIVQTSHPANELEVVGDITATDGEDLYEIFQNFKTAQLERHEIRATMTRTSPSKTMKEEKRGIIVSLDEWDMRTEAEDGIFSFTILSLDPFVRTVITIAPTPPIFNIPNSTYTIPSVDEYYYVVGGMRQSAGTHFYRGGDTLTIRTTTPHTHTFEEGSITSWAQEYPLNMENGYLAGTAVELGEVSPSSDTIVLSGGEIVNVERFEEATATGEELEVEFSEESVNINLGEIDINGNAVEVDELRTVSLNDDVYDDIYNILEELDTPAPVLDAEDEPHDWEMVAQTLTDAVSFVYGGEMYKIVQAELEWENPEEQEPTHTGASVFLRAAADYFTTDEGAVEWVVDTNKTAPLLGDVVGITTHNNLLSIETTAGVWVTRFNRANLNPQHFTLFDDLPHSGVLLHDSPSGAPTNNALYAPTEDADGVTYLPITIEGGRASGAVWEPLAGTQGVDVVTNWSQYNTLVGIQTHNNGETDISYVYRDPNNNELRHAETVTNPTPYGADHTVKPTQIIDGAPAVVYAIQDSNQTTTLHAIHVK